MLSALRKLTSRKTFEEKIYDDIYKLLEYKKPKETSKKQILANFILKKNEKKNSNNPNYMFKANLYEISKKISMLEITNPNKTQLLSLLEKTLNKFLGMHTSSVMEKLSAPALQSSRNNAELEEAFAELGVTGSKIPLKNALNSVNSILKNTNGVARAFVNPRSLTTTAINNGWEEVVYPNATNVNQNKVNNLMENATIETLYNRMPSVPTAKPGAKGGYRKIKKSRKCVYA